MALGKPGLAAAALAAAAVAALCIFEVCARKERTEDLEMLEDMDMKRADGMYLEGRWRRGARSSLLFEHHKMSSSALGGGEGLGVSDGVGRMGDDNVMYRETPRNNIQKQFKMRLPDARRRRGVSMGGAIRLVQGQGLYEMDLDPGEDYFSAIQPPDKYYSHPWLRDGKFRDSLPNDIYTPGVQGFREGGELQTYIRRPYDEYGDMAYEPDMSVVNDCYDTDTADCYRQVFDPSTGYVKI